MIFKLESINVSHVRWSCVTLMLQDVVPFTRQNTGPSNGTLESDPVTETIRSEQSKKPFPPAFGCSCICSVSTQDQYPLGRMTHSVAELWTLFVTGRPRVLLLVGQPHASFGIEWPWSLFEVYWCLMRVLL